MDDCGQINLQDIVASLGDLPREQWPMMRSRYGISDAQWQEVLNRLNRWDEPHSPIDDSPTLAMELRKAVAAADHPVIPGYEILRRLDEGGQAAVYEALHAIGRKCAIKVMHAGSLGDPTALHRFDREVSVLAELEHPNIVTVFDRGYTTDGRPFLVMPLIRGQTLDVHLFGPRGGPIPEPHPTQTVLRLFCTIADAVHAAHVRGIIHRDLKPSNILVDDRGQPHVIDFGLARAGVDRLGSQAGSATGHFAGSLAWTSPEQADGQAEHIDTRSDIYSLAVLLYHMLTGGMPYEVEGTYSQVLNSILHASPAPPTRRARENSRLRDVLFDERLDAIILKALSKRRQDRHQSAAEMAAAVDAHVRQAPNRIETLHNALDRLAAAVQLWLQPAAPAVARDIDIEPAERVWHIGEELCVCARTNVDCYLSIINIGTTGKVTVLLPNNFRPVTRIRAGEIAMYPQDHDPFRFCFSGPAGREKLVALATTEPLSPAAGDLNSLGLYMAAANNPTGIGSADPRVIGRTVIQVDVAGAEPLTRDWSL